MIVTNSIAYGSLGVGYGPLAVGPRWIAYSGTRVAESSSTLFTPELITLSSSPNVAQFAMDSSRQIASGILNIGLRGVGVTSNDNVPDEDSIGMVKKFQIKLIFSIDLCLKYIHVCGGVCRL